MIKRIKNRLSKFISSAIKKQLLNDSQFVESFENEIIKIRIEKNCQQIRMNNDSKLYKEAYVQNLRNSNEFITVGSNTHIRGELTIFAHGGKIKIGDNCYVGVGSRIWSAENVIIGNNVLISHNCNIIDTNSHEIDHLKRATTFVNMTKNGHSKINNDINSEKIYIDDNVWLSFNVTVLKGVKIGKGAIIAAGSIVTKDVEPFTLVSGTPARLVRNLINN